MSWMLLDLNILCTSSNKVKLYHLNSGDDVQFFASFPQNSRPPSLWTFVILNIFNMWCAMCHLCRSFISWSIVAFVVSQLILSSSQTKTRFRWSTSRVFLTTVLVAKFSTMRSKPNWCSDYSVACLPVRSTVVYQSISERPCDVNGELLILFYCSIVSAKIMHKYFNTVACKTQILLQIIN